MMLVSGVAQLNLEGALRFLPGAGRMAGRLVGFSYLACLGVTVLLGAVFLLARSIWPSVFSLPHASTALLLWFFVATMAWGIFAMQDNVLTGLRQATWVPVENAIFGVVKIILLVLFAHSLHQFGIFASWTIPTVLSLLPVNVLLFWYLIPRHARASQDGAVDIIPTHIVLLI